MKIVLYLIYDYYYRSIHTNANLFLYPCILGKSCFSFRILIRFLLTHVHLRAAINGYILISFPIRKYNEWNRKRDFGSHRKLMKIEQTSIYFWVVHYSNYMNSVNNGTYIFFKTCVIMSRVELSYFKIKKTARGRNLIYGTLESLTAFYIVSVNLQRIN